MAARHTLRLAVTSPLADPAWLAATLFVPQSPLPLALFCFPGGGMTRRYFDVQNASFAEVMADGGIVTACLDHFGTGGSTQVADGFGLTAREIARTGAAAVAGLTDSLRRGTALPGLQPLPRLTAIGLGHSMGAMIVAMQQADCAPYAALALLGFSTRGLPEVLTAAEQAVAAQAARTDADFVRLARLRFGAALADLPPRSNGSAALAAASGPLLTVAAMQSMLPGNIRAEAARIGVPLYLSVGDRDIAGRPETIPGAFTASPDVRLSVMPDAGHHPFIAPSAAQLCRDIAFWAKHIAGLS